MQKPSNIEYREFTVKLQDLLNGVQLPAFVIIPVMKEAINQLELLENNQYQRELEEWNKWVREDGEQTDKQSC